MTFTFNGIANTIYNLKLIKSNHLSLAAKNIELIKIPGRTGDLIIDDGSYSNKNIELVCHLDKRGGELNTTIKNIRAWLQGTTGYKTLTFSDGRTFNAVCINQIDISYLLKDYVEIAIIFSAWEV